MVLIVSSVCERELRARRLRARKLKVNLHAAWEKAPTVKYTTITVRELCRALVGSVSLKAAFIVVIIALSAAYFQALSPYLIARA